MNGTPPPSARAILHLDLDTFFVSVERLMDRRLAHQPILIGGTGDRGVVAACSYETRAFGVHSGMPMRQARLMCPEALVIRGNSMNYMKHSRAVTEIVQEAVPVCEKTSIDEFYADLSGMDRFFGCWQFARELRDRVIRETGLPISFGMSTSKTVSKVATGQAKPSGTLKIDHGTERPFLAPLSVRKIPMVGTQTYQTLRNLGVKRIQTVQEMPIELMEQVLGQNGTAIWRKAHGIDPSPVIAFNERKSISTERTFSKDTTDVEKLKGILIAMTENLAYQLRRGRKLTACVAVKVRYADFDTRSLQARIPYSSSDHVLIPKVKSLFDQLYNRRVQVRLIGVRFSHLVEGGFQMDLFDDVDERLELYRALDRIRSQYGDRSVVTAAGMEARTIGRSNPFNGDAPLLLANRHQ
ncbi:MAG: DNA polymerase IV [Flavobacteriales bacterium]|jgi:DNA polymerase-4|nr:DNA polymerase IV [Crocinitomicaceae bacterium]MEC8634544.1 DNA polymerase IV [Bacteroidota bacterium]MEE3163333.1 DNA polymerase IV [Bacteroidota bacterium]